MTRVLLIEDNPSHARLVREMLFDEWGQLADVSHRGMLADVEPALAQASDCILLDLSLPDSEGLEAVVELRAIASLLWPSAMSRITRYAGSIHAAPVRHHAQSITRV